ncbi:polysaccharide deacetylase family protein [Sporosarcina thermotolerans]|uniref:Polysaccharide deacetylase family protein n=1 Tax=Sporosarcina thermotolerans TaxID=633404 RepID=A0AAW9ABJ8_9BACL|nr:polysaccharide deacetylase family protein [Sporosarcina thermotolerans]MDW0117750.1 polysaccharide deacetylase family protein [Sporosarcina thermotolerans]WHT49160.1 polysaccharide deacetylase family protein [Sporosarcina thermotolerans]
MKKKILFIGTSILLVFLLLVGVGTYELMNSREFQLFGGLTNKVETNQKVVALTFDDGPTKNTDDILTLLKKYDVKTTFFLIGNEIEKNPEITKKILDEGHQIGNHTYSHQRMIFKSPSFIKEEIEKTDDLIRSIGFEGEIDFRPPNGKKIVGLPYYLFKVKKDTITWNLEPDMILNTTDKIDYINKNVTPGSIILMHPMFDESGEELKVIEGIIESLLNEGYTFVTVNELQNLKDNND